MPWGDVRQRACIAEDVPSHRPGVEPFPQQVVAFSCGLVFERFEVCRCQFAAGLERVVVEVGSSEDIGVDFEHLAQIRAKLYCGKLKMLADDVLSAFATQCVEGVVKLSGRLSGGSAHHPLHKDGGCAFHALRVVCCAHGHDNCHCRRGNSLHRLTQQCNAVWHLADEQILTHEFSIQTLAAWNSSRIRPKGLYPGGLRAKECECLLTRPRVSYICCKFAGSLEAFLGVAKAVGVVRGMDHNVKIVTKQGL